MTFTWDKVINSIADQLAGIFPDGEGGCLYPIRRSPTQDTTYPCFFIFPMNPSIDDGLSGILERESGLDIVFVQQRNADDQNEGILAVQEALDEGLDMLTYSDGTDTCQLHLLERNATIEDQELHYKVTIRQRVSPPRDVILMETMEEDNVEIKGDD